MANAGPFSVMVKPNVLNALSVKEMVPTAAISGPSLVEICGQGFLDYFGTLPPFLFEDLASGQYLSTLYSNGAGNSYAQHPYLGEAIMQLNGHSNRSEAWFKHMSLFWQFVCYWLKSAYYPTSPLAIQGRSQGGLNPQFTHLILENGSVFELGTPTRVWSSEEQSSWSPELILKPDFNDGNHHGAFYSYAPYVVVNGGLIGKTIEPAAYLVHPWLGNLSRNWIGNCSDETLTEIAARWATVCKAAKSLKSYLWPTPLMVYQPNKKVWIISPKGKIEEYVLPEKN